MRRSTVSLLVPSRVGEVRRAVEPVAFWVSVLLPLGYVPLLFGGFTDGQVELFLALVGVHVASLVIGHGHGTG
jgi:hypothetical protein